MSNENQALILAPKQALSQLVFGQGNPISNLEAVGTIASKSGAFGFGTTQGGAVAVITCIETGITLTEYHRTYDCIDGKPRKKAMAALVEFVKSGGKFEWLSTGDDPTPNPDDRFAKIRLERDGKKVEYAYSIRDAKQEGLVKPGSRWDKRPGNMLRARCCSNGIPLIDPGIFAGEDDTIDRELAPLLPERKAEPATVTAAPPVPEKPAERPSNVIDIQATATPHSNKNETPATAPVVTAPPAEAQTTAPAATVPGGFKVSDVRADPATGKLSPETVMAIDALIPVDLKVAADKWLKEHKYITASLEDMNIERARRILSKPDAFIKHVKEVKL